MTLCSLADYHRRFGEAVPICMIYASSVLKKEAGDSFRMFAISTKIQVIKLQQTSVQYSKEYPGHLEERKANVMSMCSWEPFEADDELSGCSKSEAASRLSIILDRSTFCNDSASRPTFEASNYCYK